MLDRVFCMGLFKIIQDFPFATLSQTFQALSRSTRIGAGRFLHVVQYSSVYVLYLTQELLRKHHLYNEGILVQWWPQRCLECNERLSMNTIAYIVWIKDDKDIYIHTHTRIQYSLASRLFAKPFDGLSRPFAIAVRPAPTADVTWVLKMLVFWTIPRYDQILLDHQFCRAMTVGKAQLQTEILILHHRIHCIRTIFPSPRVKRGKNVCKACWFNCLLQIQRKSIWIHSICLGGTGTYNLGNQTS